MRNAKLNRIQQCVRCNKRTPHAVSTIDPAWSVCQWCARRDLEAEERRVETRLALLDLRDRASRTTVADVLAQLKATGRVRL